MVTLKQDRIQMKTEGTNISREKININTHNVIYATAADNNNQKNDEKKSDLFIKSILDHNIILEANQDKLFTLLNRLINSKKCMMFYVCLMVLSVGISIYAIANIIYPKLSI